MSTSGDTRSIGSVPEGLQTSLGPDLGDNLYTFLDQARRLLLDYQINKSAVLQKIAEAAMIVSAPGPTGVPGPPGPPAGPATPDMTPPPTPSGVVITAGLNTIFVQTADPVPLVTQGHGYQRTIVYGSTLASPTFSDAVVVHEFEGQIGSFSSNLGVTWHIWLKWKTNDGVLSTTPSGGAGGDVATTGKIGNADLNDLIITAGKLADGSVTAAKILGGAVDASKLAVEIGGGNLVANSSFEVDSNADGLADSWVQDVSGSTGTLTYSISTVAADVRYGISSQRIDASALTSSSTIGVLQHVFGSFAGNKIAFSAWIGSNSGRSVRIQILWYNSTGTFISATAATSVTANGQYQRIVATVTAPALAAKADFYIYSVNVGATAATVLVIDGTQLEFGDVVTAYAPRPDEILAGAVVSTAIADGAVTAVKTTIAAINAATGNLNSNTVDAAQIVTNAITSLKLAAGAVTAAKTAIAAIDSTSGNLVANSVTTTQLAAGAVTAAKIAADTITANEIAAGAIGAIEIAAGAVTTAKLAAGAVTTVTLAAGAVTANEIATDAVTANKIIAGAVVVGKIAANAVGATEIAAGSVTTNKLVVTGRGMALNDDPGMTDVTAWTTSGTVTKVTLSDGVAGVSAFRMTGGTCQIDSRRFQATATRQYKVACYIRRTSGTGSFYLRLYCYNASNTLVNFSVTAVTPAIGNFENVTPGVPWVRYVGTVVAGTAVVEAHLTVIANFSGGTGVTEVQDLRVEEYVDYDLIVDGAIIATKLAANAIAVGSAAIQNGAIVNAMLGNAVVDTAKIANAAIVTALIADANITGAKIANATITTAHIGTAQITSALIADANITTAKIGDAQITNIKISDLSADKINAGAIRGINVNASSHTTKGSYLTSAPGGGATTLNVKDTTDFAASGSGFIIDTSNDRDAFTYTGKTSTTLTGCSGVLAHNNGATVVPATKGIVLDAPTNEARFYGDRGDGTIEELASIGIVSVVSDVYVGVFGSLTSTRYGVLGSSLDKAALRGMTVDGYGVSVTASGSGTGVLSTSINGRGIDAASGTDVPVYIQANATKGHLTLFPLTGRPSNRGVGQVAMINTTGGTTDSRTGTPRLFYTDGTNWLNVHDNNTFGG